MRSVMTLAAVVLVVLSVGIANATIIGTYVDAVPSNTDHAVSPGSPWGTTVNSERDNLWETDQGVGSSHESFLVFGGNSMMCCYGEREPSTPTIATTITGLTPGASYEIRLLFGNHSAFDLQIMGGLDYSSLSSYKASNSDMATAGTYEYEEGYMNVRQALLGTGTADAAGEVKVYVAYDSSLPPAPKYKRAIYDGVSYVLVPEPGTLALLATGLIGLLCYAWRKRK